jgi:cation diffusion facilitator CzcD-associated flavoprotein CzcO
MSIDSRLQRRLAELAPILDRTNTRYREERDKRLRDGRELPTAGTPPAFAHVFADRFAAPIAPRAPIEGERDVVIIGAGFGGLLAGVRLHEANFGNLCIVDEAADFGGTWYWNRYPGAQCDVESYVYLPLLEETHYVPSEKYASRDEIFAHIQRIARHYDLYRHACFQTRVEELRWSEPERRWIVSTNRGDRINTRHVIISPGPLNRAKLPGIAGLADFKGHICHTSRWDYDYTGGDSSSPILSRLGDKRVAVIGTGATGLQCIPYLAEYAQHLYVVQRTPAGVDERNNQPTDPDWVKKLRPGWQRRRIDNFTRIMAGAPLPTDIPPEELVSDRWVDVFKYIAAALVPVADGALEDGEPLNMDLMDLWKMDEIRTRVTSIVREHRVAEALQPWYRYLCKRPTFSDTYLQTFNRPNVTLLDASVSGVERITAGSMVVNGIDYPVDSIVFATGFSTALPPKRRFGFEIHGRDRVPLSEHWKRGPRTLHGLFSNGFPNLFFMGQMHSGLTVNQTHMLDLQAQHISALLKLARQRGIRTLEPTADAEARWVDTIIEKAAPHQAFWEACTPGYYNNEGRPQAGAGFFGEVYAGGPVEFYQLLENWRADGGMSGLATT